VQPHVQRQSLALRRLHGVAVERPDVAGAQQHLAQRRPVALAVRAQRLEPVQVERERLVRLAPGVHVRAGRLEAQVRPQRVACAIPAQPDLEIGVTGHVPSLSPRPATGNAERA
jgi:hypothetical protein